MRENPFYSCKIIKKEKEEPNADLLEELSINREDVKPWSVWNERFSTTASKKA